MITELHEHCERCDTKRKCTVIKYITDWLQKKVTIGYKCQTCKNKWYIKYKMP